VIGRSAENGNITGAVDTSSGAIGLAVSFMNTPSQRDRVCEPYRVAHYNRGRPHTSLGPGIPDPPHDGPASCSSGHQIRDGHRVVAAPVLGGLHHEYRLEPIAA
jgi:hypothetical protein